MRPLCPKAFRFWHCFPQPVSHPLEQPVVARYRSWSMHSYSCVYDVSSVTSISGGVPTASWPAVSKDLYTRVTVATYITMHVPEIYAHLLKESFAEFVMTKPWPPCWTQMCVAMCFSFRSSQVCSLVLSRLCLDMLPAGTCLPPPAFCALTSV